MPSAFNHGAHTFRQFISRWSSISHRNLCTVFSPSHSGTVWSKNSLQPFLLSAVISFKRWSTVASFPAGVLKLWQKGFSLKLGGGPFIIVLFTFGPFLMWNTWLVLLITFHFRWSSMLLTSLSSSSSFVEGALLLSSSIYLFAGSLLSSTVACTSCVLKNVCAVAFMNFKAALLFLKILGGIMSSSPFLCLTHVPHGLSSQWPNWMDETFVSSCTPWKFLNGHYQNRSLPWNLRFHSKSRGKMDHF